jgi:NAD(P)-dependent dehydrogenase (short-subunit alcohol dehydrogenase family)
LFAGPNCADLGRDHRVCQLKVGGARIPLGRYGRPGEVADAILFLLSPKAGFINGHVLNIDGGFSSSGIVAGR